MSIGTIIIRSNQVAPDSRVEKEASALAEYGYNVKILAWDRRSNHNKTEETIEAFGQRIPIIRFGHKANFGDGFKSLKPYLIFQWNLFRWLVKNKDKYDVIHACDFDTALTSTIANIFCNKLFIFDIFDYIGGERKTLLQKFLCKLQTWIINRSDATIICTEDRKRQISASHPKKLCVVHNSPPQLEFHDEHYMMNNNHIKICYVGILQDYRLLDKIPEFFKTHPDYELHIGGFGKYESLYQKLSEVYPNIKYYGRLQYNDTLKLEQKCDIMLAIYDSSIENHVFAAPNKFYEGLMLGKPLIMVHGTGMSKIVDEHNIGEIIEYSTEGFERGVLKLASRKEEWPNIHEKMKRLYNEYSWQVMKLRLANLYEQLTH